MSSKARRNERYLTSPRIDYEDKVPTFEEMVNEVRRLLRQSDLLDLSDKRVRTRFLQDLTSATFEAEEIR